MQQVDFVSVLVGGLIGSALTFFIRIWLLQIEELSERFNDLCRDITNAADTASEYWLAGPSNDDLRTYEAKLVGYQSRIIWNLHDLTEHSWYLRDKLEHEVDDFLENMSGGEFQVCFRQEDPDRAKAVQQSAAQFITRLRQERRTILRVQMQ